MFRSFYQNISHHKGVEQSNLQLCLNIHLCHYNIGHRSFHIGSSSIWCYKYLQSDTLLVIQCQNNSHLRCLSNLKDLDEKEKNNIKCTFHLMGRWLKTNELLFLFKKKRRTRGLSDIKNFRWYSVFSHSFSVTSLSNGKDKKSIFCFTFWEMNYS